MSWIGYLVLASMLPLVGYLWWIRRVSRHIRGQSVAGLAVRFPPLGIGQGRAVIYCYRSGCAPCRQMAPFMEYLSAQYPALVRLDVEAEPEIACRLGIRATPTILLVEDGKVTEVLLGTQGARTAAKFLGSV